MAVPKALGFAAPNTAKPISAAATLSNKRLLPDAMSPLPRRADKSNPPIEAVIPEITYAKRKGKYMKQRGVTLPKV